MVHFCVAPLLFQAGVIALIFFCPVFPVQVFHASLQRSKILVKVEVELFGQSQSFLDRYFFYLDIEEFDTLLIEQIFSTHQ